MVCVCERPVPNGLGECGGCHRLVLTHSWAEGRPPVACTPTNVTEIVAGSAIWDATDRQFKFVDANPPTTATLQTVTYTDGVVDDYNKAVVLHVADNPWQASRWNSGEPLEQAS